MYILQSSCCCAMLSDLIQYFIFKNRCSFRKKNHRVHRFLDKEYMAENLAAFFLSYIGRSNERLCFSVQIWPHKDLFISAVGQKQFIFTYTYGK